MQHDLPQIWLVDLKRKSCLIDSMCWSSDITVSEPVWQQINPCTPPHHSTSPSGTVQGVLRPSSYAISPGSSGQWERSSTFSHIDYVSTYKQKPDRTEKRTETVSSIITVYKDLPIYWSIKFPWCLCSINRCIFSIYSYFSSRFSLSRLQRELGKLNYLAVQGFIVFCSEFLTEQLGHLVFSHFFSVNSSLLEL